MKLVVIESPYAGNIQKNTRYARACMADSIGRLEAPIASHLIYTQPGILDENIRAERDLGIKLGYAWIDKADLVAFYANLGWSGGMLLAQQYCQMRGKLVVARYLTDKEMAEF